MKKDKIIYLIKHILFGLNGNGLEGGEISKRKLTKNDLEYEKIYKKIKNKKINKPQKSIIERIKQKYANYPRINKRNVALKERSYKRKLFRWQRLYQGERSSFKGINPVELKVYMEGNHPYPEIFEKYFDPIFKANRIKIREKNFLD